MLHELRCPLEATSSELVQRKVVVAMAAVSEPAELQQAPGGGFCRRHAL